MTATRWRLAGAIAPVLPLLLGLTPPCAAQTIIAPPPAASSSVTPLPRLSLTPELEVRTLRPGVHQIIHHVPWAANSLLVELGTDDLILVDTPYTPEATSQLLDWIRTRFGPRRIQAINTHFHNDRLGGNVALIKAGIPVHGSDLTVRTLGEREARFRRQLLDWLKDSPLRAKVATQAFVPPDHVFPADQGLTLTLGGETVEVLYPGPGHSPDNLVVYFPQKRLLFGGCLVMAGVRIGNTSDADLGAWAGSVRRLKPLEVEVVVPGHGERLDPGLIDHTLELLSHPTPSP